MQLSDLRYITQENIDEAHINIISPEMYTEAREYNTHMLRMRRKQYIFTCDFWGILVMNFALVPVILLYSLDLPLTLLRMAGAPLWLHFVLPVIFWLLYGYFFLYRKLLDWRVALLISALMIPAGILFVITTAATTYITWYMRKTKELIEADIGYPSFVELKTTFIRKEVEEQMNVYAKSYVKPPDDDESFLFSSDISADTAENNGKIDFNDL